MYSKIFVSLIIVLSICFQTSAQNGLPKRAIGKPKMFDHPTEDNIKLDYFDEASEWWRVFSDRDGNPVYDKPNGNVIQHLSFMQSFVVAEYKKGWIHIASTESSTWPHFDQSAQDIGWVKANDMLLWNKSLEKDLTSKIERKAMIVISEENIDASIENQQNTFFKDPFLSIKGQSKPSIFEIFYVFKIDAVNRSVLLGRGTRLGGDAGAISKLMLGWLPFSKITFWDHRQCLEPNPDQNALDERQQKGIEAAIFRDPGHSQNYAKSVNNPSIDDIWTSSYTKRMPGNHIRFPILNHEGDLYNVGYIGKWGSDCPCNDERLTHKKDSIIDKKEKLHFIFVIDATESMKNYYNPVSAAIGDLISKMKNEKSRIKISLSAVVYRNSTDPYGGTQRIMRTDKLSEFNDFLRSIKLSKNKKDTKAVYMGLKEALTYTGISKSETNFVVLIGDTWDDLSDNTTQIRQDIKNSMVDYKTNFVSFQVYNEGKKPYIDFQKQSRNLLIDVTNELYNNSPDLYKSFDKPRLEPIQGGYKLNDQPVVGSFLFANSGSFLSADLFQNEITIRLKDFEKGLVESLLDIENLMRGEKTDYLSPKALAMLNEVANKDVIDELKEGCTGVIMKGYTTKSIPEMEHPLFADAVFMTRGELATFVNVFEKFINLISREAMLEAWKQQLRDVIGEKWGKRMTFDEAYHRLAGIPCPNKTLKNKKIKNITSRNAISEAEFRRWNEDLSNSIIILKQNVLMNPEYEGKYEYNNEEYYWVPLTLFP